MFYTVKVAEYNRYEDVTSWHVVAGFRTEAQAHAYAIRRGEETGKRYSYGTVAERVRDRRNEWCE